MRILFVGGGTGGHFYPLIAIAESVHAQARAQQIAIPELYYMGPEPYDQNALAAYTIRYIHCPAGKRRRDRSLINTLKNSADIFRILLGFFVALWKLYKLYPDTVMSKGGYTSVPVVLAAWVLRIPIVIHESDAVPGRANTIAKHFARYIAISYENAAAYFPPSKTALTGIPLRSELLGAPPENPHALLGIKNTKPLICILGGSQGAARINDLIATSLDEILTQFTVIHQVGDANVSVVNETARTLIQNEALLEDYHIHGFMDVRMMHAALSTASVVIARAGSTTIYEVAAHGVPTILIPIPEEISHDQRTNAYSYARDGAASVIEEKNLTTHLLLRELERIMNDSVLQNSMRKAAHTFAKIDAAPKIADVLIAIGLEHGS